MAAHTAYLDSIGSTETVGAPDGVPIVVPGPRWHSWRMVCNA